MVTFKSATFCITLNKNAITHILQGNSAIKAGEVENFKEKEKQFNNSLKNGEVHSLDDLYDIGSVTGIYGARLHSERQQYLRAKMNYTLITIGLFGGNCIDLKVLDLKPIEKFLSDRYEDAGNYLAVADVVNFILHKLNTSEFGHVVDFTSPTTIEELYDFTKDTITARKVFISKSLTLKPNENINLTDYLIHYTMNDGKYSNK